METQCCCCVIKNIMVFCVCSGGFPFSMENIPRKSSLSLKAGSILTALLNILYSVLVLVLCSDGLCELASQNNYDGFTMAFMIAVTVTYSVTLLLTALMLAGVLWEIPLFICLWVVWSRIQLMLYLIITIRWTVKYFSFFSDGFIFLVYAIWCLSLLLRFYLLTLVVRYFEQLAEKQVEGERVNTLVHQDNSA